MTSSSNVDSPARGTQRRTDQQRALNDVLADLDDFSTAQEIFDALRARGERVSLTTVYRRLQTLVDAESVDVIRLEDGEFAYRRCESDRHHHHLVCRTCGRTVEVSGPAVERWADRVAEQNGFRDVEHQLELFGICSSC